MDSIKAWAAALCIAAIVCAVLQMLAPKEGTGKVFKLILSAFFLCCLIMPLLRAGSLTRLDISVLPGEVQAELLEDRVNQQLMRQVQATVERLAETALDSSGVKAEKIEVKTDTSPEGSIYIQQVTITLDKQSKPKALAAREVLEKQLGVSVVIETTG